MVIFHCYVSSPEGILRYLVDLSGSQSKRCTSRTKQRSSGSAYPHPETLHTPRLAPHLRRGTASEKQLGSATMMFHQPKWIDSCAMGLSRDTNDDMKGENNDERCDLGRCMFEQTHMWQVTMGCQKHQNYQQHDTTPINTQMYEKGSCICKKKHLPSGKLTNSLLWKMTHL